MMTNLLARNIILTIGIGFGVLACSSGGGSGFGGSSGGDQTAVTGKKAQNSQNADDESATPPAEVSGAFLACAYMESGDQVRGAIESKSEVQLGCGFYTNPAASPTKVDLTHATLNAKVLCADSTIEDLDFMEAPSDSQMHVVAKLDPTHLPCVMQVGVNVQGRKKVAYRRAIATVSQFNASEAFDVKADLAAIVESSQTIAKSAKDVAPATIVKDAAASTDQVKDAAPTAQASVSTQKPGSAIGGVWGVISGTLSKTYGTAAKITKGLTSDTGTSASK